MLSDIYSSLSKPHNHTDTYTQMESHTCLHSQSANKKRLRTHDKNIYERTCTYTVHLKYLVHMHILVYYANISDIWFTVTCNRLAGLLRKKTQIMLILVIECEQEVSAWFHRNEQFEFNISWTETFQQFRFLKIFIYSKYKTDFRMRKV